MPRYFYHVYDDAVSLDDEGVERADDSTAIASARQGAAELACSEVLKGHLHLDHRVEVENEAGTVIARITFRDVVRVEG